MFDDLITAPHPHALQLLGALQRFVAEIPYNELSILENYTLPKEREPDHDIWVKREKAKFDWAMCFGFDPSRPMGSNLYDLRTLIKFDAQDPINNFRFEGPLSIEEIRKFPIDKSERYSYIAWEASVNDHWVELKVGYAARRFLVWKLVEDASLFVKEDVLTGTWRSVSLRSLIDIPITVNWGPGTVCIADRILYSIWIAQPDAAPRPVSEAASAKVSVARNRRGPKPELKLAMRDAFSQLQTTPDQFDLVAKMTQEMRLRWVGGALTLPEDEWPSRSYVEEVWRQWVSEQASPEL